MGILSKAFVETVSYMPESVVWRFARRYIAGTEICDGLKVRSDLYSRGMLNTMDILGEDIEDLEQINIINRLYCELVSEMHSSQIPGNISIKLTQFGLRADPVNLFSRVRELTEYAGEHGIFLRIDMEDATTTSTTLDLYNVLRQDGHKVGAVLQAYLKRSQEDVIELSKNAPSNIRICKGIYKESPDIAFQNPDDIRDNFINILGLLFDMNSYPAIATHDPILIKRSLEEIKQRRLSPEQYEFQMLHGVGFNLRKMLLDEGHPLRIYIPFGKAWRAYSLRRFRENPKLAFYVLKNIVSIG